MESKYYVFSFCLFLTDVRRFRFVAPKIFCEEKEASS